MLLLTALRREWGAENWQRQRYDEDLSAVPCKKGLH